MAKLLTPPFRVSYPNVFKAKLNKLSGKEEYSLVALFPKDADLAALKKAAVDVITEKWGADKTKWPAKLKLPFRDQSEREKDGVMPAGHEKGAIFMNLKSKDRPGIVDQQKQEIIDPSEFYAGCWARASVNAFVYDQAGNRGVSFGLNNLQKVKDGDSLSGRTRAEDDFAQIESAPAGTTAEDLFN